MQKTINKTATITRAEMEKLVRAHYKLEDDFKIVVTGLTYDSELDLYNKFILDKNKTAPALPNTVWCSDNLKNTHGNYYAVTEDDLEDLVTIAALFSPFNNKA